MVVPLLQPAISPALFLEIEMGTSSSSSAGDPLASFDRVLDSLLIAPTSTRLPIPSIATSTHSESSSSNSASTPAFNLEKLAAQAAANAAAAFRVS
jgi:hypothetical protein